MKWMQVTVSVDAQWAEPVRAFYHELDVQGTWTVEEGQTVHVHAFFPPDRSVAEHELKLFCQQMRDISRGEVDYSSKIIDDQDWQEAYKQYLTPVEIGSRLLIFPRTDIEPPHTDRTVVQFDADTSFGTGHHATTRLVLEELEPLISGGERILDIGTGSGVLALSSVAFGAGSVVAIDNDIVAVRTAKENAKAYDSISVEEGDASSIRGMGRFDVVLSNLTVDTLLPIVDVVADCVSDDGVWLMSGIIEGRWDELEQELQNMWKISKVRKSGVWVMARAGLK